MYQFCLPVKGVSLTSHSLPTPCQILPALQQPPSLSLILLKTFQFSGGFLPGWPARAPSMKREAPVMPCTQTDLSAVARLTCTGARHFALPELASHRPR